MKKKSCRLFFALIFISLLAVPLSAQETEVYAAKIPDKMLPYTEIIFSDTTHYRIIKGGSDPDYNASSTKTAGIPDPVAGVTVTYANDGYLQDITFPEGVINPLLIENVGMASVKGTALLRAPIIQGYQLMHTWGASLNYLYCNFDDNHRRGIGRATTFSDVTGQADITNFKGSVATKLAYDNIDTWTAVYVRTVNSNGITHTEKMKKTDAGGMPDAIVDIWKTGIEYWGYTWSSSFSMPNRVYIEHNNPHD